MGARTDLVAAVDYSSMLLVDIHWSIFSLLDGNEKLRRALQDLYMPRMLSHSRECSASGRCQFCVIL